MLYTADLRKKLVAFCKGKTQAAAAKKLGVTPAQLSRALSGKATVIPARIARKLGYQAIVAYVPKGRTATKTIKVVRDSTTGRTLSKTAAKANPSGTTTETQVRAVKPTKAQPKRGVAVRKSTAQKNREHVASLPKQPIHPAQDRAIPFAEPAAPVVTPVYNPRAEDEVIDIRRKD